MLRSLVTRGMIAARAASFSKHTAVVNVLQSRNAGSTTMPANPAEFVESILIATLRNEKTTGYELRAILNTVQGEDLIPSPKAIEEMMLACRRVNDYALAVRTLEAIQHKCSIEPGLFEKVINPVKPTLEKLGVLTPAQMGYDKPELYLQDAFDIH